MKKKKRIEIKTNFVRQTHVFIYKYTNLYLMYNNFCDMVLPFHSISYAAMVDAITVVVAIAEYKCTRAAREKKNKTKRRKWKTKYVLLLAIKIGNNEGDMVCVWSVV